MTDAIDSGKTEPLVEKSDLVNQTSHGPTLNEVASHLLRQMLKEQYPDLDIDPDKAVVGSPQWQVIDDEVQSGPIRYESLTHALVSHGLNGTTVDCIEGEHFLTLEPQADDPVQLAVSIEEVALTLNEAIALLFIEFQDRQLSFWNQKVHELPRWQTLSNSLRKALNVNRVKGWDADECTMAREVFAAPARTSRKSTNTDFSDIQACLIDIDVVENEIPRHLLVGGALVIKATYRQRQLIVLYTIERGYESFDSLENLGSTLPGRLDQLPTGAALEWRLFEPDGNVFDHMAWALVSSQIDSIDQLRQAEAYIEVPKPGKGLDTLDQSRFKQLDAAIPDWLRNAPANDMDDYRRYITALGKLYRKAKYRIARTEIPSISQFAHQSMRDAIIADKSAVGTAAPPWDDLQINITNSFTVDNFTLPNPLDQHIETMAEFALENDAPYRATLSFKNGAQVPDWLTPQLLTRIAAKVDVGGAYPALVKKTLIDDPVTSRRQAHFYRDQLRWLLPLKALEEKIKQESGVTEQGYQYICKWMNTAPGPANPIAIYPLTLKPQHRLISASDTVTNMFIISPRDDTKGACLLYRPMQDVPLMQFPSRQNLLYALHQPGDLRDSVLAWLATKTLSFEYSQYVFPVGLPSPWLAAEQLVNPFLRAEQFGRVVLETREMTGDTHTALFRKNAQALVTLADRQSQSNAERRWTLLKDSSWALFSVATNFLSGAVGTAVWAWQVIEQIQQALDAHEKGDSFNQWRSEADILLSLGIMLSHHAVMRRKTLLSKPGIARESLTEHEAPAPATIAVTLDMTVHSGELPSTHDSQVAAPGSVPRRSPAELEAYLDAFNVTPPGLDTEDASKDSAIPRHLHHFDHKTYAKVGKRWFIVSVTGDDQVQIVDPDNPAKYGPLLASDNDGRWVLDLRWRLKGGGPKHRRKTLQDSNQRRRIELKEARDLFQKKKAGPQDPDIEGSEEQKKNAVAKAQAEFSAATAETRDRLSAVFVEKTDEMIAAYRQALEQLREWHALGGGSSYISESLRMHTELEKYHSLWFFVKKREYVRLTRAWRSEVTIAKSSREAHVNQVQQATDLSQAMVERLVLSREELDTMDALGMPGVKQAILLRKLAPSFTEWEIRANEIGIAQELCLEEQASATMTQARDDVGNLTVRGATAAHRISKYLKKTPDDLNPQQQIEELSQLIETFADVAQRFRELPEIYPGHLKQASVDHLLELIDGFAKNAEKLRSSLLEKEQQAKSKESAGPSKQAAMRSKTQIKVKKTRPRQQTSSETPSSIEESLGVLTLEHTAKSSSLSDDADIVSNGFDLVDDVPRFIEHTRKDAYRPSRIPADMQEIFDQQASKLKQSADSVKEVLTRTKQYPVAGLPRDLLTAAETLRESGKSVRASLYKLRKPTQSIFKWMHDNAQIDLRRDQGRIKTKQLGDYFQEYRILDRTNKDRELWVAHFHYPTLKSPQDFPTAAHLKISETYLKTLTEEQQKTFATVEPIDGVLRKIDDPALRKLFFDLEPAAEN
ncbi:dermonecrotic toxin domain-containing protein [Pseudomonas fluorescens]|uniref:Dermonecrotic toxin N-terminal domain-containing protein n=1 Tax=Pseudomonas fluorescens TaxID=294 RepID=A0A5E7ELY4_PSEFL|nr:DUF6543 domain-containing protein [Pseudomonas fluorescens]VVO27719.1 hypothetical protein PS833_04742 [Pseudomonas fluorescens]